MKRAEDIEVVVKDYGDRFEVSSSVIDEEYVPFDKYRDGAWYKATGNTVFFKENGFKIPWLEYKSETGKIIYA